METPLRNVRVRMGLSLADMASILQVSRATVQGYERRDASGTIRPETRARYLESIGMSEVDSPRALTPEQERSRKNHLRVLAELTVDPDRVVQIARDNLRQIREVHFTGPWVARWEEILDCGVPAIEDALFSREQWAADLRQTSPFAGVLEQAA